MELSELLIKSKLRSLILNGAIGTVLQDKLRGDDSKLWSTEFSITHSEEVYNLYEKYIIAGADIITTNTFRSNPAAVILHNSVFKSDELVNASANIAKRIKETYPQIIIAGSNPPAEDCYRPERTISHVELRDNHIQHINSLVESGVDFILNETQSHFDEIKIICEHCIKSNIPFSVSLYFDENLRILSGENVSVVIDYLVTSGVELIIFNCIKPEHFFSLSSEIKFDFNWGVYLNCGRSCIHEGVIIDYLSPEEYKSIIKNVLPLKPVIIGSCCGSNPEHTKSIKELIHELYRN